MKHYPAQHHGTPLAGLEHTSAPARFTARTLALAVASGFAAGACATVWFINLVIQRT